VRVKLVIAIVQDRDADQVIAALTEYHLRVTRIASTGGFLQQGNTTLLVGVETLQVNNAIEILRRNCRRREMFVPLAMGAGDQAFTLQNHAEVEVGGATVFIADVERFEQY
jgi:uncharacterized protein YaaQ